MTSFIRSWSFVEASFAGSFRQLEEEKNLRKDGPYPVIWDTKQKYVLKVPTASGISVVYKSYNKLRSPYKYTFRLSPCGAEALNSQLITALGIDMPKLLAVGDVRKNTVLKTAYIVFEFAEGFRDGRDFMPDGCMADQTLLRNEFICRNLELLARCHDNQLLHRGFTPANLMYKVADVPDKSGNKLVLKWIDVASCRKVSRCTLKKKLIAELMQFFRFFDFSSEELTEYISCYYQSLQYKLMNVELIVELLQKKLQERAAKHK